MRGKNVSAEDLTAKKELALEVIRRLKAEYPDAGCTLDYDHAWQLLVSVRLAAQCTDARVNLVTPALFAAYPTLEAMAAADIAAELRRLAPHSDTSFVLDTLEYMWKGGRCSGVTALGANMLKLKPCLEMREGKLAVCKKYRGAMEKVYRQYITERLADKTVVADHAFITHSGEVPEETLSQLTALVRELAPFEEVFVTQAGCTVSSHCGPGTLGVLFLQQA